MEHPSGIPPDDLQQTTILIADDSVVFRIFAETILKRAGHQTVLASDGEQALSILRANPEMIDLVLSDIDMPRLDGIGLRRQILTEYPSMKVLLMSAAVEVPAGTPFLKKPFEAAELVVAVGRLLPQLQTTRQVKKVLVLEDDESSRFVIRSILERAGFSVIETVHGAAAVQICQTHPERISLMVADVVLRDPAGVETVRKIKELHPEMSILYTSGYPMELLENRGLIDSQEMEAGKTGYIQKPFTAPMLLEAVRKLVPG